MKSCLITLIVCCSLLNRVCGQSPSAAIDSLVKYKVITAKQRPMLKGDLIKHRGSGSYRTVIIEGLYSIMLQNTFHYNTHTTGFHFSYSAGYATKNRRDSIKNALRLLLNNIKRAGLLTDRVYAHTLKDIDSNGYFMDIQMTGSLAEMSSRQEWLVPGKLMPVAKQLHQSGVVSDSSFALLQNDIRSGKIESAFELNNYCKLDKTIDLKKYPDDPHIWLEQMHRDIASTMPGLNFTNFNYTTKPVPASSDGFPETKYKISLTCNGRIYKYAGTTFDYGNKKGPHPTDIFAKFFFRIFNKVLADQQSPFRLHNISFGQGVSSNEAFQHLALLALREEQAEVFMKEPCLPYMLESMESYDSTLTSGRIDSTIAGWKDMGLFAHLPKAEIDTGIDDTQADERYSINKLLANFPHVVYALDLPMMNPGYPYVSILNHLADITHGAFNPTQITQRGVKGGVKLQYLSKGTIHSHMFHTAYGWQDSGFLLFMKRLGRDNNLTGNFYSLPYNNEVIYLTDKQHLYAIKNKLLDFSTIP